MTKVDATRAMLVPHPSSPTLGIRELAAYVGPESEAGLEVRYRLTGDLARLRIPPQAPPCHTDGLWRHTCFEAFVAAPSGGTYREFNASPSGEWAAYAFRAYRDREAWDAPPPLAIGTRVEGDVLELTVRIPSAAMPGGGPPWQLGLSAVIEAQDEALAYWALAHPEAKPDFHRAEGFLLQWPA